MLASSESEIDFGEGVDSREMPLSPPYTPINTMGNSILVLAENCRYLPLPRYGNAETSALMEKLDSSRVFEYFARLLNWELRCGGYDHVVREDTRTMHKLSKGRHEPESGLHIMHPPAARR